MRASGRYLILVLVFLSAFAATRSRPSSNSSAGALDKVQILVLPFESPESGLGDRVSHGVMRVLDQNDRYETISVKQAKRRLPRIDFKDELSCIHGRQLAITLGAPFMVCGRIDQSIQNSYSIDLNVVSSSGSSIYLVGVRVSTLEAAAHEIARRVIRFIEEDAVH